MFQTQVQKTKDFLNGKINSIRSNSTVEYVQGKVATLQMKIGEVKESIPKCREEFVQKSTEWKSKATELYDKSSKMSDKCSKIAQQLYCYFVACMAYIVFGLMWLYTNFIEERMKDSKILESKYVVWFLSVWNETLVPQLRRADAFMKGTVEAGLNQVWADVQAKMAKPSETEKPTEVAEDQPAADAAKEE